MKNKRWPLLIVALLATHVGLMSWAVVICSRGSNPVIPNYYEKALRFDQTKAAKAQVAAPAEGSVK